MDIITVYTGILTVPASAPSSSINLSVSERMFFSLSRSLSNVLCWDFWVFSLFRLGTLSLGVTSDPVSDTRLSERPRRLNCSFNCLVSSVSASLRIEICKWKLICSGWPEIFSLQKSLYKRQIVINMIQRSVHVYLPSCSSESKSARYSDINTAKAPSRERSCW